VPKESLTEDLEEVGEQEAEDYGYICEAVDRDTDSEGESEGSEPDDPGNKIDENELGPEADPEEEESAVSALGFDEL
jgi:hypothetical protein